MAWCGRDDDALPPTSILCEPLTELTHCSTSTTTIGAHLEQRENSHKMSIRRRTTVHDVASLRVHPDGTRVQNTQAKSDGSTTAPRPHRGRNVVRDAKGNWIASDAGGSAFIRDIIVGSKRKEQGNGDSDEDLALGYDEGEGEGEFGSRKPLKDSRAKRRKTFYSDFSFLEDCSPRAGPSRSVSTSLPSSTVETDMGLPSSVGSSRLHLSIIFIHGYLRTS